MLYEIAMQQPQGPGLGHAQGPGLGHAQGPGLAAKLATKMELLEMSLLLCPQHVPSLIALADMELQRMDGNTNTNTNTNTHHHHLLCAENQAHAYATSAVRANEMNPEAW